jgi:carboxypeptidase PM20D1
LTEPGIDAQRFIDHLGEAIRIRTVSHEERDRNHPGPFHEFHAFLRDSYPLVIERCTVESVSDLSLLITWEGSNPELDPVVLMAHMDVVPVEEGTEKDWDVDPYSGDVVDGELWGRGALDDKGPLVAIMEAVEHLLRSGFEPDRSVIVALGHDEEIGGLQGGAAIAAVLRDRGVRPWFVLDEGGGVTEALPPLTKGQVALVKTAEKGYVTLELTATGAGGHSSTPPRSTAIGTLSRAIRRLETKPFPASTVAIEPLFAALEPRLDPRLRPVLTNLRYTGPLVTRLLAARPVTNALVRTTTAVTVISGGVKSNVLPQHASAIVNFRILQGDTIASVIERVRRIVGPDITVTPFGEENAEPSRVSSQESAAWSVVRAAVAATFPEAIVAPWTLVGMTDSRHFADIAGDVYGFGPFVVGLEGMDRIHGTGERIRTADAGAAVSFFVRVMRHAQKAGSFPP